MARSKVQEADPRPSLYVNHCAGTVTVVARRCSLLSTLRRRGGTQLTTRLGRSSRRVWDAAISSATASKPRRRGAGLSGQYPTDSALRRRLGGVQGSCSRSGRDLHRNPSFACKRQIRLALLVWAWAGLPVRDVSFSTATTPHGRSRAMSRLLSLRIVYGNSGVGGALLGALACPFCVSFLRPFCLSFLRRAAEDDFSFREQVLGS